MSNFIQDIIEKLLAVRGGTHQKLVVLLSEKEVRTLVLQSREIFLAQPGLIDVNSPLKVCGDIHGQYYDLLRLFDSAGYPSQDCRYLFLGDYVDRGKNSIETICLMLAYKILLPNNFFLLRGNHECGAVNKIYGFYDDCKRRYNIKLWKAFTDTFNCMPLAGLVEKKLLCMHGGLSPELLDLAMIRDLARPLEVPEHGVVCDLLWADPSGEETFTGWKPNDRGVSFTFGRDIVHGFLQAHDLDLICRAHQVVEHGYQFYASRALVTIFSAPNYCGEFDNAAAVMSINTELVCSFQILKPPTRSQGRPSVGY